MRLLEKETKKLGCRQLTLRVLRINHRAIGLYQKLKFAITETKRRHHFDGAHWRDGCLPEAAVMKTVVISQPMYFPWVGMLEQMALADVFVHLDDAQFSKGGFFNRVQIKTAEGTPWLTVPLAENKLAQALNETQPAAHDWPRKHRTTLQQPWPRRVGEMVALVEVLAMEHDSLAALSASSMRPSFFGCCRGNFADVGNGCDSTGSERVLTVCQTLGATRYVRATARRIIWITRRLRQRHRGGMDYETAVPAVAWRVHAVCQRIGLVGQLRTSRAG